MTGWDLGSLKLMTEDSVLVSQGLTGCDLLVPETNKT